MNDTILVIGAPGNVGTPVVEYALQSHLNLRIGAYDDVAARERFNGLVDVQISM
ncbi:MAG: hypothetical protein RTS72_03510 [Candidatus Thorarchaeota archaeon]